MRNPLILSTTSKLSKSKEVKVETTKFKDGGLLYCIYGRVSPSFIGSKRIKWVMCGYSSISLKLAVWESIVNIKSKIRWNTFALLKETRTSKREVKRWKQQLRDLSELENMLANTASAG